MSKATSHTLSATLAPPATAAVGAAMTSAAIPAVIALADRNPRVFSRMRARIAGTPAHAATARNSRAAPSQMATSGDSTISATPTRI